MTSFQFSVIVPAPTMTHEQILGVTDALGEAGCLDASICGHADGIELLFERTAESLQAAISSAISDTEKAGLRVSRIELKREAVQGVAPVG